MYTHSTTLDYPSISQINLKVKQNSINVIFAVTAQQIDVYNKLAEHIEGSTSAILSEDSSNVVDLVRGEYSVSIYLSMMIDRIEKLNISLNFSIYRNFRQRLK